MMIEMETFLRARLLRDNAKISSLSIARGVSIAVVKASTID